MKKKIKLSVIYYVPLELKDGTRVDTEDLTVKEGSTLEELISGIRRKYKQNCNIEYYIRNLSYNGTIYFHNKHKEIKKIRVKEGDTISFFSQISGG